MHQLIIYVKMKLLVFVAPSWAHPENVVAPKKVVDMQTSLGSLSSLKLGLSPGLETSNMKQIMT